MKAPPKEFIDACTSGSSAGASPFQGDGLVRMRCDDERCGGDEQAEHLCERAAGPRLLCDVCCCTKSICSIARRAARYEALVGRLVSDAQADLQRRSARARCLPCKKCFKRLLQRSLFFEAKASNVARSYQSRLRLETAFAIALTIRSRGCEIDGTKVLSAPHDRFRSTAVCLPHVAASRRATIA